LKNPFRLSTLRRQTSGRAYVPEVDGLRFIAILSVVLFHIAVQALGQPHGGAIFAILTPVVHNGYRGVELFFVISGFILGLPFARHRLTGAPMMRLRDYFLRRLTRLEPPYFVILLVRAALIVVALHTPVTAVLPHLLASLGYAHSLIYGYYSTINPPVWSLEVEIQFYCLAPLLAWVLFSFPRATPFRRILLVALILASGVLQMYCMTPMSRSSMTILYSIQYFLAGFLLCDLYVVGWESIRSHWLWDVVCLPLWIWVFWWNSPWYHVWLPLACVVLYVGAFKGPVMRAFFRNPVIATIGGMCYSIYLTHNLVLTRATALFRSLAPQPYSRPAAVWLISAFITLTVFAAGLVFYVLLERPCMERDWPRKLAASLGFRRSEAAS
jgi:peptidoglycan/LPS O-acetylase OafA/YrhL